MVARFVTGDDGVEGIADGKNDIELQAKLLVAPAFI